VKVDGLHPRKLCQPANSFMDWDKVIVLDGCSSHSFHAKPIVSPSDLRRPIPDGIYLYPLVYTSTKNKIPGNRIHSAECEKYGQTTATIENSQLERKTTQVTINLNPLSYFTNVFSKANPQTAQKRVKSHHKKAQPYRLSD